MFHIWILLDSSPKENSISRSSGADGSGDNSNKNSKWVLQNIYYVPDTVLRALHEVTCLILTKALWSKYYYYTIFTDDNIEE